MLQFKDIQSNHPVFILNKQDLTVTQGKVINAAFARVDNSNGMPQMVRDIDIEMNGKIATYSIPENLSITYANKGDVVIATERTGLANEITAMRNTAKQVLESVDRHKAVIEKADALLADLDPAFKEKAEHDKKLSQMEKELKDLKDMMSNFIKEFKS